MTHFWLRDEDRATERRTALTPKNAKILLDAGFRITVEKSKKRAFSDVDYAAIGCNLVASRSWVSAPSGVTLLGLKELREDPVRLTHPMIHFAHIYKDQTGWETEMKRFTDGGGQLYDIEFLTNDDGRRVAAFGYWAGWMGAALGAWRVLERRAGEDNLTKGVSVFEDQGGIVETLKTLAAKSDTKMPRAVVIGAKGRSGSGAVECLKAIGFKVTEWDKEETQNLDRDKLLSHELLVNCVLMFGPGLLLANKAQLSAPTSNMQVISDVSCDPFSDFNPLPVYSEPTSWTDPLVKVAVNGDGVPVEVTAIDNLPSLLPKSASIEFSDQFVEALKSYPDGAPWINGLSVFNKIREKSRL